MPAYPNPIPEWMKPGNESVFDSPITRGLRAVGRFVGVDDPNQIMGTAAPMMASEKIIGKGLISPHPAIRALMDVLSGAPTEVDPAKTFLGEKVGGYYIPHRAMVAPPTGFELPSGTSAFIDRAPELVQEYASQRNAFVPTPPKEQFTGKDYRPLLGRWHQKKR